MRIIQDFPGSQSFKLGGLMTEMFLCACLLGLCSTQASDVPVKATIQGQGGIDILVPLTKLARCAGSPVRLEYAVTNGQLYAFWLD
jgi:hypothetical protein